MTDTPDVMTRTLRQRRRIEAAYGPIARDINLVESVVLEVDDGNFWAAGRTETEAMNNLTRAVFGCPTCQRDVYGDINGWFHSEDSSAICTLDLPDVPEGAPRDEQLSPGDPDAIRAVMREQGEDDLIRPVRVECYDDDRDPDAWAVEPNVVFVSLVAERSADTGGASASHIGTEVQRVLREALVGVEASEINVVVAEGICTECGEHIARDGQGTWRHALAWLQGEDTDHNPLAGSAL